MKNKNKNKMKNNFNYENCNKYLILKINYY